MQICHMWLDELKKLCYTAFTYIGSKYNVLRCERQARNGNVYILWN